MPRKKVPKPPKVPKVVTKHELCKDIRRREHLHSGGQTMAHLEECNRRAEFDGMCSKHYIEFLHALLHEREETIATMTTNLLKMRRSLLTGGKDPGKLRGGSVSSSFVGSNG